MVCSLDMYRCGMQQPRNVCYLLAVSVTIISKGVYNVHCTHQHTKSRRFIVQNKGVVYAREPRCYRWYLMLCKKTPTNPHLFATQQTTPDIQPQHPGAEGEGQGQGQHRLKTAASRFAKRKPHSEENARKKAGERTPTMLYIIIFINLA